MAADVSARLAAVESVLISLRRFNDHALANMEATGRTNRAVIESVNAEHERRRGQLAAAERRTAAAQGALARCREHCEPLVQALAEAQRHEARCRDEVRKSTGALKRAEAAVTAFATHQRSFGDALLSNAPQGISATQSLLEQLEQYLETGAQPTAQSQRTSTSGAPTNANHGAGPLADAPIASIVDDRPESLTYEKASREQIEWGLDRLKTVVEPAMAMGKGLDYFQERDRAEGLTGEHSYAGVYRWFYSDDSAIKLSRRSDGSLEIVNGYHRVRVARELGIHTLPARIQ